MRTQNLRIFSLRPALVARFTFALVTAIALLSIGVSAQIAIPLTMTESPLQTFKTTLEVGIGSLPPLSISFDTGSVGLELFATPGIPDNGTTCSDQTISVSYGNPVKVTYSGVICNGKLNLASVISTPSIPFGLLTSLTYCAPGNSCTTPQQNYANGYYGVFGAGLFAVPGVNLPNPLRTLRGARGDRFMVRLSVTPGEPSLLFLAPSWNYASAIFPQSNETSGALNLPGYAKGQGCVLVNGQQTAVCPTVVFDTGAPVPFVYVTIPDLPTVVGSNGDTYVAPGTTIGLTPRVGGLSAVNLVATDTFAGEFRYANQSSNIINAGIQAFLGNDVTYDGEQGVITVTPTVIGR
jgi:hypothetical protein